MVGSFDRILMLYFLRVIKVQGKRVKWLGIIMVGSFDRILVLYFLRVIKVKGKRVKWLGIRELY